MSQQTLDIKQFASFLGCSTMSIRRLVAAGKAPPPLRVGKLLRWPCAVVEAWVDRGCPPVTESQEK